VLNLARYKIDFPFLKFIFQISGILSGRIKSAEHPRIEKRQNGTIKAKKKTNMISAKF